VPTEHIVELFRKPPDISKLVFYKNMVSILLLRNFCYPYLNDSVAFSEDKNIESLRRTAFFLWVFSKPRFNDTGRVFCWVN